MSIKKREIIENIKYNCISIIILINSFQLIFSWNFNIKFNMWIEYALVFLVLLFTKFKIKNINNIIIMSIFIFLFLLSYIFVNTPIVDYYINEFCLLSIPLLLIFLLDIDLKKFTKIFYVYNIINILLYLIYFLFNSNGLVKDYMTFGYYSIFSISYIILYSFYNKHYKIMICALVITPLIIINGNRGIILVLGVLIFSMILTSTKMSIFKKLVIFISIMVLLSNISSIAKAILDFSVSNFNISRTYSINNLYNMLEGEKAEDVLGSRYDIYMQAIKEIKKHLFLGMGIAGFQSQYGYFPHNIFLDVYSTFGIIMGTIYILYIVFLGVKMYKISKLDIQVKIMFLFMLSNLMKLMLSKTFVYDAVIWLYISFGNLIITKYYKEMNVNKKIIAVKGEKNDKKSITKN